MKLLRPMFPWSDQLRYSRLFNRDWCRIHWLISSRGLVLTHLSAFVATEVLHILHICRPKLEILFLSLLKRFLSRLNFYLSFLQNFHLSFLQNFNVLFLKIFHLPFLQSFGVLRKFLVLMLLHLRTAVLVSFYRARVYQLVYSVIAFNYSLFPVQFKLIYWWSRIPCYGPTVRLWTPQHLLVSLSSLVY